MVLSFMEMMEVSGWVIASWKIAEYCCATYTEVYMGMHETEATSTNYLQFTLSRFTATDGGDAGDRRLQALHAISPGL